MEAHRLLLAIKTKKNGVWLDKIATMIVGCPEEAAVKVTTMESGGQYMLVGNLYKMDFETLKLVEVEMPELNFKYKDK